MKKFLIAFAALAFAGSAMAVTPVKPKCVDYVCDPIIDSVSTDPTEPTIDSASTTDPTEPFADPAA
jgi:hypothetical protein